MDALKSGGQGTKFEEDKVEKSEELNIEKEISLEEVRGFLIKLSRN